MNDQIFNLIKDNNFIKLKELLLDNLDIKLDIYDKNHNYFINYLINLNQIEIIKIICLKFTIRLDIIDSDGRTILYNLIKYNNIEVFKLLLEYNKKIIGISIIDIRDNLGYTALHYAVIFNNFDMVTLLYDYDADLLIKDNNGMNIFHIALDNGYNNILIYLLNKNIDLTFLSKTGDTLIQLAISYQNYEILDILLTKKINIDNQEIEYGICALHQAIIINNIELINKLIKYNSNINSQDFFGNSILIYAINEGNNDIINILLSFNHINYNIVNLEGNTALHILLNKNIIIDNIKKIIKHTDLSIQNNLGETCLFLIIKKNLFLDYANILEEKELNIFIKTLKNKSSYDLIKNNNKIINSICNSYYFLLLKNKNNLLVDWEIWCGNNITKKIASINKNNNIKDNKIICKEKIKDIIINENRAIPKLNQIKLTIDTGIFVDICFYTGSTIDILAGLIFLYTQFKKQDLEIIIDYKLTENPNLKIYYESIGIDSDFKLDFINFEIIWSFQKIIYPTYFDIQINNKIKNSKYIIIPIGIETTLGSHANILFWDIKNKIIERFEPNGSNEPKGLNYNSFILDQLLKNKFKTFDTNIKYLTPNDYLPIIGFQILENFNSKCKRIGDPNGFCGVWCIWWIFQKMKNINIESSKLIEILIKEIKYNNIDFKTLIRNFSKNITDIRDTYLKKFNIDINDWMGGNYNIELLDKLDYYIYNSITKI